VVKKDKSKKRQNFSKFTISLSSDEEPYTIKQAKVELKKAKKINKKPVQTIKDEPELKGISKP